MNTRTLPPSKHFTIQELAKGVYAAVATKGGAAISNAGIIDLGNRTLVFDTFLTPQAARDLRTAARDLTDREPEIVINSHYHNDHIWGNQVFDPKTQIISTTQTRHLIQTEGKAELEWAIGSSATRLEEVSRQLDEAKNDQERNEALLWIGYYKGLVEDLPEIMVRLPDITFDKSMTIHAGSRTLDLISFEDAHTKNDTVLFLRDDHILFMADLLFVGCHPFLAECDPTKLLAVLKKAEKMEASILVPGHGPVGGKNDIKLLMEYITFCLDTSRSLVAQGNTSVDQITKVKIPERFSSWELTRFFHTNLQSMCEGPSRKTTFRR